MSNVTYDTDYFNQHSESSSFELQHPTEELTLMMVISKVNGPTPYDLLYLFVGPGPMYMIGFILCGAHWNPSIQLLESFEDIASLGFVFDPSLTLHDAFEAGQALELCEDEYDDMQDRLFEFGVLYLE